MKRRIRSIFWLMVVCMLGINGFQAYWLYNTYQLTAGQFARTAREALAGVVQRYQLDVARQFIDRDHTGKGRVVVFQNSTEDGQLNRVVVQPQQLLPEPAPGADAAQRQPPRGSLGHIIVQRDIMVRTPTGPRRAGSGPGPSLDTATFQLRVPEPSRPALLLREPWSTDADTMVRKLSKLLISNFVGSRPVSLPQLAADYHAELRLRGTDAPLALDTFRITIQKAGLRPPPSTAVLPPRPGFSVHTPPVALNPFQDLYVRAAFRPPTSYVLRRMGGLLAGSVLLLALTSGCFGLMLSTILRQKKLSDVKNDFINNMTHELKTPLATVSAAVEALQNFGALRDPAKTETYLRISRTELQRLSDLVEKVLNIAVDERRPPELTPEPVPPAELVAEIVARHQLQATKPVHFDVQVTPAPAVRLDRLHMGNVINNLIDNAIKYSPDVVNITIRGRQVPGGWQLTVADDGPGIEPAYQEAIFDQFFRVPTGNLHNVKGFGLGLYYVRQVVERHGGRIAVRSGRGRGSEFAVWIPQE